MSTMRL